MEELNKIKRSNIRIIIAILLVIIYFIITVNWYYSASEELRQKANDWQAGREVNAVYGNIGSYIGNNKMGIVVKELCDRVLRGNLQRIGSNKIVNLNEIKLIYIKEGDISQLKTREDWANSDAVYKPEDIINLRDTISTDCKYDIKMSGDEQGFIIGIGIIKKGRVQNIENEE